MKITQIQKGICPNCDCKIAIEKDGKFVGPNDLYTDFWVLYDDGSNANFAICKDCLEKLTLDEAKKIQQMQRYTWGMEIIGTPLSLIDLTAQLKWYVSCGALLEVIKFGKTKEEIIK